MATNTTLTIQTCVEKLFQFDKKCTLFLISKALGFGVVFGSLIVKFPQIIKMMKNKSSQGLSEMSFVVEIFQFAVGLAYSMHINSPFSTYGENLFILVQCYIQVFLLYLFRGEKIQNILFKMLSMIAASSVLFLDILPEKFWMIIGFIPIIFAICVKCPQILENWKNSSTGQLAFLTQFLNLGGTLARIFTTFQEVNDKLVLCNYILCSTLNFTIVAQFFYYWNAPIKEDQKKKL